jgi:4,5:9,10-diseco-3-hydroxy-5,9,17-trioxoandrosta-1(10),2-diene-4-oate hydrolase
MSRAPVPAASPIQPPQPAAPLALEYIQHGGGAPVVLLHGIAASRRDWDALLPALAARGYRGLAPDLLGHGDSPKPGQPLFYNIASLYLFLERWVEQLGLSEPADWVGHSLGGYLSLLYSLRHPEQVRSLALIDPLFTPAQINPLLAWMRRWPHLGVPLLRWTPEWLVYRLSGLDPGLQANVSRDGRRQIASDYKRASPNFLYIPMTVADLTPYLGRVRQPALVIWGKQDRTLSPASFPRLARTLPRARGHAVPGCGHQPHIAHPELVNRLVLEFLEEVSQPPAEKADRSWPRR